MNVTGQKVTVNREKITSSRVNRKVGRNRPVTGLDRLMQRHFRHRVVVGGAGKPAAVLWGCPAVPEVLRWRRNYVGGAGICPVVPWSWLVVPGTLWRRRNPVGGGVGVWVVPGGPRQVNFEFH